MTSPVFSTADFPKWEFPTVPPCVHGWVVWDEQFRRLIRSENPVVIEVGSWLGKTALHLLAVFPKLRLYCIDKWSADNGVDHPRRETSFETWKANLWDYQHRVSPVRCSSERGLVELRCLGVKPDLIYIDGAHDYSQVLMDVHTANAMFPEAIICGDDYTHNGKNARMRVGEALDTFTEQTGIEVKTEGRFWLLDK